MRPFYVLATTPTSPSTREYFTALSTRFWPARSLGGDEEEDRAEREQSRDGPRGRLVSGWKALPDDSDLDDREGNGKKPDTCDPELQLDRAREAPLLTRHGAPRFSRAPTARVRVRDRRGP